MKKHEARELYKQKRKKLSQKQVEIFQKSIYNQIYDLDLTKIEYIHIFLPIVKQKEINTFRIINFLHEQKKTVIISKSNFNDHTLKHFIFTDKTKLIENSYGIPEPMTGEEIDVKKIDLVFVPLLISDKKNYRVGYGKGFYDRFLASCRKDVITIGLNFFPPIALISDTNKFDIPLNNIIYPS